MVALAEEKLYDAATKGDVKTLQQLMQQDPFLVDQVSFARSRNVLHIATMVGQVGIVEELLRTNSEICWWVDDQGMNPVHIAAMRGHVEILKVLLQHDLSPAMERLHRGQTVLHLCVKHHQLEALIFLVEKLGDLAPEEDDGGETILHLAVRCNQHDMVKYLLEENKIKTLTENSMGKTPLDILRESSEPTETFSDTEQILLSYSEKPFLKVFRKITGTKMVVMILIAGMAFQAVVSPPGGVWQNDMSSHTYGKAVMASTHPELYKHFSRANTTAFISSLIVLLLVMIPSPKNSSILMLIIIIGTVVSMASIGVSYGAALIMINPIETQTLRQVVTIVVSLIVGILAFIGVGVFIPPLYLTWKRLKQHDENPTIFYRIIRCYHQFHRDIERAQIS